MAGGGGSTESGEPEFQIAPMIDVLLVLLIFFMSITSAQVLEIDKDIKLPVAADAKKKDKNAMFETAINVRWIAAKQQSIIKLDSQELDNEAIVNTLTQFKNANAAHRVIIRGDRDVPAVEIQKVMALIAQSGIDDISFSTLNQDG
ncbi:biopolymer transport protein ExbD [Prosthecobacter fusiformis]|uniref:Biopolymer transport protein ExbD n=1 Tax=Prosthecobacter fusiformis TaxID=48464 RepID=A0A4R7RIP8_9BACT|nr:biopolymer transporter ExbD [Prosthecobacter fusiformis]TDU63178.1 biopolymer transport protein ExbD [Prosthecobacter fusiformis]